MFKSIKTGVLAIILIGTAIIAKAQKVIDSGTITYGIAYLLTDEQAKFSNTELLPSESKVEFNGKVGKVQTDLGLAMLKILTNPTERSGLVLVDVPMMQKQYAAKMSKEDIENQHGNLKFSDFKDTGEQQVIAGFNAKKYTYKDNNGASYELWATNELKLASGANPPGFEQLNATPVKFTDILEGVKTVLTLKTVKEGKVGPFTLDIPKGYELKTLAELKAMRAGR